MSRILPTPLVFISGYANTENVFYCLIIVWGMITQQAVVVLIHWMLINLMDSFIQPFNNWGKKANSTNSFFRSTCVFFPKVDCTM